MKRWGVLIVGLAIVGVGVVLGFVKSGECGSVFQPPGEDAAVNAVIERLNGMTPTDCSTALDLTAPTWGLIVVGGIVTLAGAVVAARQTTDRQDARPSAKA